MKKLILILVIFTLAVACNNVKDKAKEAINKSGEVMGKGATEFAEGVTAGVDKTLECEINVSPKLVQQGIKTGKFLIENDSCGGEHNKLVLYLIFDKDFKANISVKAYDKKGLEVGRTKAFVSAKAGEAKYTDFSFDKRTYIEVKSKLVVE